MPENEHNYVTDVLNKDTVYTAEFKPYGNGRMEFSLIWDTVEPCHSATQEQGTEIGGVVISVTGLNV